MPPTSDIKMIDIKMIDIWLVLCQMVPFVEVILLTAMEFQRKDETQEMVESMEVRRTLEDNSDDPDDEDCQRCWTLDLKTVGKYKN